MSPKLRMEEHDADLHDRASDDGLVILDDDPAHSSWLTNSMSRDKGRGGQKAPILDRN